MTGTLRLVLVLPILAAAIAGCDSAGRGYAQTAPSEPEEPSAKSAPRPTSQHDGWVTDLEKAKADAKASNKMLLVDFTATWCGPCQEYVRQIFPSDAFKQAAADYILVSVDVDKQSSVANQNQVSAIPDIRIFSPNGDQLEHLVGYYGEKLMDKMKAAQKRAGL